MSSKEGMVLAALIAPVTGTIRSGDMLAQLFNQIAGATPIWVRVSQWIHGLEERRPAIRQKPLRLPGESTQRRLFEVEAKMTDSVIVAIGLASVLVVGLFLGRQPGTLVPHPFWLGVFALCGIAGIGLGERLSHLKKERKDLQSGLKGEQVVAAELNDLAGDGCYVFHDFLLATDWNIDHIVVRPSGVYAIETATQLKRRNTKDPVTHEVVYDGRGLQFGGHYDAKKLAQTRAQAEQLEKILSSATDAAIKVEPILTLPGWTVRHKSREVMKTVMNPKMLKQVILSSDQPALSAERIQQIVELLDQKCRS
jgi:Nuclease-related domain